MPHDIDSARLLDGYTQLNSLLESETSSRAFSQLTRMTLEVIPGAESASITRGRGDHYQTIAPTGPDASGADRLQYEIGTGPCLDALMEQRALWTGDVRRDTRWPSFGPSAAEQFGIVSMLSIGMVVGGGFSASLNVYSRQQDTFSEHVRTFGTAFAAYAGVVLGTVLWAERVANLEKALASSRRIGMAVGVLMAGQRITGDQAFTMLRTASQNGNRRVSELAEDVIETGELPTM